MSRGSCGSGPVWWLAALVLPLPLLLLGRRRGAPHAQAAADLLLAVLRETDEAAVYRRIFGQDPP